MSHSSKVRRVIAAEMATTSQKVNWIVIKLGTRDVYYEAIDETDANNNCPPGHIVMNYTDEELNAFLM